MNKINQKTIVVGLVLFTFCAAISTSIYLPYYSETGKNRREQYRESGKVEKIYDGPERRSNNMWNNINSKAKDK
jgi:hypothetical protein